MTPREILEITSSVCDIDLDDMLNRERNSNRVYARTVAVYLFRKMEYSYWDIAHALNLSSHASAMSMARKLDDPEKPEYLRIFIQRAERRLLDAIRSEDEEYAKMQEVDCPA